MNSRDFNKRKFAGDHLRTTSSNRSDSRNTRDSLKNQPNPFQGAPSYSEAVGQNGDKYPLRGKNTSRDPAMNNTTLNTEEHLTGFPRFRGGDVDVLEDISFFPGGEEPFDNHESSKTTEDLSAQQRTDQLSGQSDRGKQGTTQESHVQRKQPRTSASSPKSAIIDAILTRAVEDGASDIHLSVKSLPLYRLDGDLKPVPGCDNVIDQQWMDTIIRSVTTEKQYQEFLEKFEKDMSYNIEGLSRFRLNIFHQRGTFATVFRVIPDRVKTLEELNVSSAIYDITRKSNGLVLVTGPTGSGKSTTLAAIIDKINKNRPDHIVTIEDPIEFVHSNHRALINQREVGSDTTSFAEALKRILRQDPDVILVGELRDPETISVALTAAETGHLVFGTLHTQSASKTIDRIIDSFPSHQQNQVKSQLSGTLQAVVSQMLIKRRGGGRTVATEIMVRNNAIANNIRQGNVSAIYSAIQTGSQLGMHTLDQNLIEKVLDGTIEKETALSLMENPANMPDNAGSNLRFEHDDDWRN